MSEVLTAPEESSGDDIRTKARLIKMINEMQTRLFGKPVDDDMFNYLIDLPPSGLMAILLALKIMIDMRKRDTL